MPPLVSVVIAAYNAAPWIAQTIGSVLAQTYRDFEVVVVDDGSTDATPELVAAFGAPVRLVQKPNGGAAAARNAGVEAARGRYVAFLDHDDLWEPGKLEAQMRLFEADPSLAWAYTDALYFDSDTDRPLYRAGSLARLHEGSVFDALLLANFIPFASAVVRRDVLLAAGLFDERPAMKHVDDWDLWLRIAPAHPVGCVPEPLVRYRVHATQATQNMDLDEALGNRLALLAAVARRQPGLSRRLLARAEARACVAVGRHHLNREARRKARRLFGRALRLHPTLGSTWVYWGASFLPRRARRLLGRLLGRLRR